VNATAPQDGRSGVRRPLARHARIALLVVSLLAAVGALAYLRDPPWLPTMTTGMREWETGTDGTRFRWAGAHSSLFVTATARAVRIPVRTTFDRPGDWPIAVSITLDDELVDRLVLTDAGWRMSDIRLPPPGSRRVRRIDIRADRVREENRAVLLGEIGVIGSR
jgi:hypothetical protein